MGLTSNTALPHDIARDLSVVPAVAEVVADRAEVRSAHEIEERLLTQDLHVVRANSLFDAETAAASETMLRIPRTSCLPRFRRLR